MDSWGRRSIANLASVIRDAGPHPGDEVTADDYAAIIAFVLRENGFTAAAQRGDAAIPREAPAQARIGVYQYQREAAPPAVAPGLPAQPDFAEFGVFLVDRETPVVMYLNGPIDDTAVLDFRRARRAHPEGTIVVLNSPGGFLGTALTLADEVFQAGLTTIIPSWAGCYSACAFVFLAGVERLALGELGVHQFTSSDPDLEDAQRILADVLELLNLLGTPQELISLMLRTPPDDMHIFAADEIQALAISRGAPTGMDGIEEMGAFLLTFAPPILARASADLVVDPDGERQDVQGEVIWGVTDEDGVFAVVGQIELGGGDITGTIVILGPTEDDGEGRLFLGFSADDDLLRGSDRRTIETVFMTRSGSQRSGQTSFVQAGYDDEEGQFILVSSLRWMAFDLALLQQSRSIEILLTGGDQVDALVVIGINDEVAIVLSEALSAWGSVSAGFPIGDSPTLEVPRTAYLNDGGTRTEALATWYTAGCELAFRFDLPERDILIDVGFAQSRIYVSLEPADAFSNGVDAVTLISVGEDFDWIEGGSGFFFADLRSVDPLAMIAFLDWTSAIELLLKYADGTWARIVVTKGPSFGQLLDAAAATWTAAVAVDPSPLPGAPPKTPKLPIIRKPRARSSVGIKP